MPQFVAFCTVVGMQTSPAQQPCVQLPALHFELLPPPVPVVPPPVAEPPAVPVPPPPVPLPGLMQVAAMQRQPEPQSASFSHWRSMTGERQAAAKTERPAKVTALRIKGKHLTQNPAGAEGKRPDRSGSTGR